MVIRLTGDEYVYWSEGSGKNRRSYSNRYQNYDSLFSVTDFNGQVQQGHYIFPFGFLLPTTMSGSFNHDDHCYIRYTLRVIMNHPTSEKESQIYEFFLNIMEPPRIPVGITSTQRINQAQCCGCCKDYGTTVIDLKVDKNFAFNGDPLQISGMIDHSKGNTEIEQAMVKLVERRVVISSGGSIRTRHDAEYYFGQIGKINPGQTKDFLFQAQVPEKITSYTAIGRVTARYVLLIVDTEMGCCTTAPFCLVHMIINSKTPNIMKQEKMPPPEGWYPQECPKVTCNNMSPFTYSPLLGIPFTNNSGKSQANMEANGGMHPYFQEDNGQVYKGGQMENGYEQYDQNYQY